MPEGDVRELNPLNVQVKPSPELVRETPLPKVSTTPSRESSKSERVKPETPAPNCMVMELIPLVRSSTGPTVTNTLVEVGVGVAAWAMERAQRATKNKMKAFIFLSIFCYTRFCWGFAG